MILINFSSLYGLEDVFVSLFIVECNNSVTTVSSLCLDDFTPHCSSSYISAQLSGEIPFLSHD